MQFKQVVGQTELKRRLSEMIQRKRISHAQLFSGPEGSGALAMAIAYAQMIFCESPTNSDSCGTCRNCLRMQKLQHPDLHFSFPIQLSSGIALSDDYISNWRELYAQGPYFGLEEWYAGMGDSNKQGTIGTKEAEKIVSKISLKSFEGGHKVLIMWLPEMMNISASNKLLKIIEEPPPKTLFLLVAENPDKIISTITSRTQIIKLLPPKEEEIKQYLISSNGLAEQEANNIAHLSERNLSEAKRLIVSLESSSFNLENFIKWMRLCYKRDVAATIDWVDDMAKSKREQHKSFLKFCLQMFRNSIIGHYTGNDIVIMTDDQKKFLDKFAPFINHNNIVLLSEAVQDAHYHIERNANPKITLMDLSLKIFLQLKKA